MTIRLLQTKIAVENEWLSEYQTELLENKSVINITKLVPNLMDKKKCCPLQKPPSLLIPRYETQESTQNIRIQ